MRGGSTFESGPTFAPQRTSGSGQLQTIAPQQSAQQYIFARKDNNVRIEEAGPKVRRRRQTGSRRLWFTSRRQQVAPIGSRTNWVRCTAIGRPIVGRPINPFALRTYSPA
jgi:hypothetical protein